MALIIGWLALASPATAAEVMRSFRATYDVQQDGSINVVEEIAWDFGVVPRHGIFRDLIDRRDCGSPSPNVGQPVYPCKKGYDRRWKYDIRSVEIAEGTTTAFQPVDYKKSSVGDGVRLQIGDPDLTISGLWTYRITYVIRGALDAYSDHDELFWNATGQWPVAIEKVAITLTLPGAAPIDTSCFQGARSNQPCKVTAIPGKGSAIYETTRLLVTEEQLTIVGGWDKGRVTVKPPILDYRGYFHLDALEFGGAAVTGVLGLLGVVLAFLRHGRDRRFRSLYYLTQDPTEETKPPFGRTNVVVEFLPPDDLRPAQMGLILDERADPLDVTATIVDLAVRGYLHITETRKGSWTLTRTEKPAEDLMPYEATILDGIFKSNTAVTLGDLKNKFHSHLSTAQAELYDDAQARKWFPRKPALQKGMWLGLGLAIALAGAAATFLLAITINRALIGVPIVIAGLILAAISPAMAHRSAMGSEALRRVLGFRLYIATAEKYPQKFNEEQNIFARYLPYAIVFQCVTKWAKAFEGLDGQPSTNTTGWYTGVAAFSVLNFSNSLSSFSNSIGSTIVSTPSSSGGGSGFSGGGFSGGGGGGGGGGSW